MNLYIKLLFAIMILYTFYNFYMDFRGVINGGTFLEGNQNMVDNEELTGEKGSGYRGKQNKTRSGKTCQNWNSQSPQKHKNTPENKPNSGLGDHNFCRNPDGTETIWCYTTDPETRWELCDPLPPSEELTGEYGSGYRGKQNKTRSGKTCQKWNSQSPQKHKNTPEKKPNSGLGDHNFCRNPDGETGGIWCYTTDPETRWEHCDPLPPSENNGLTQEQIDIAVAEAMGDSEVKSLTQKIFDKFKVSYNNSLSKQQLKDMLRQIDDQNLPPEGIEFAATFILALIDFNKNEKLDFNEMLLILLDMKKTQNSEFKRIQNIFSPSYSNNNNNNNYQTLANGNIVIPATGNCPNGCKMPAYDHKDCENTLYNGKSYRQCPWVSVESSHDCGQCGAVLLPKNEHGYAKTQIGYSDVRSLEIISKRIERQRMEQRMESKKQLSRSEFFNIGKEFLKQHGELKGYDVPDNITVKEYTLLGKVLFIYLANKTQKNQSTLKNYIDSLYLEHYLNNKCDNCENMAESSMDKETVFNLDELKKRDAYAYTEGIIETESDNRLGGSRTQYDNRTAYRSNYKPQDPRKFPNPYNSMWDVFQ